MHTVKIRLENEEYQPVLRLAQQLKVGPADLAYAGIHEIMRAGADAPAVAGIAALKTARASRLPNWADHSREIHAYESMT